MPDAADATATPPNTVLIARLLGGQPVDDAQIATLHPRWAPIVEAIQHASPDAREEAQVMLLTGQASLDRLLQVLGASATNANAPWPDPIPFDRPPLPEFPLHVLPTWLTIFIRSEAMATQTPPDLAALLALAVLSTVFAGRALVNPWGDWIEPLNVFLMVVLPPGHRKSAIFASITAPLQQFEADAAIAIAPQIALARRRRHVAEQALLRAEHAAAFAPESKRAARLAQVEQCANDVAAIQVPIVPRLIVDDCSPERLATILHDQGGRIAILSPEGGIFDLIAGRYSTTGAPNLDHYLKGHAGDPIVVDRVGRPGEIVPRPALTIGLTVQPEVLRHLASRPGFHGRGLLARFLYALPSSHLGRRAVPTEPVHHTIRRHYHDTVRLLLTTPYLPPCFPDPFLPPLSLAGEGGRGGTQSGFDTGRPEGRGRGDTAAPGTSRPVLGEKALEGRPDNPRDSDPITQPLSPITLHFTPHAADRLRRFAEQIEPRLAPTGDLDPLVDWGSKLVGAVARISALLQLATTLPDLPAPHARADQNATQPSPPLHRNDTGIQGPRAGVEGAGGWGLPDVDLEAVEAAIILANYLAEHARAAYAAMGTDTTLASVPVLLSWLKRTRIPSFSRRDAQRATRPRLNNADDLDDALDQLEQHHYIRQRATRHRPGAGRRSSPIFDVHPSLIAP